MHRATALAVLLFAASAIAGNFTASVSGKQFSDTPHDLLTQRVFMFNAGTGFDVSTRLDLIIRGGFGSMDADDPEPSPGMPVYGSTGRIWTLETGLDFDLYDDFFFIRATAGRAYLLRDYCVEDNTGDRRYTDSRWENVFSMGLGSRFPINGIFFLDSMHFMLSGEILGSDHSMVSGEIGVSI